MKLVDKVYYSIIFICLGVLLFTKTHSNQEFEELVSANIILKEENLNLRLDNIRLEKYLSKLEKKQNGKP